MNNWRVNGKSVANVAVADRGLQYGDGLFETIAVREGQPRFIEYHLQRLAESANRLSMELPLALLQSEINELISNQSRAVLKVIVTRGQGKRGYRVESQMSPTRILGLSEAAAPVPENYRNGIRIRFCATPIGVNPATAGMKTLNRLEQVMARSEWSDESVPEGLMCTPAGLIISGTMSNLFLVKDGTLMTPDLSAAGIAGIMRRVVLEHAQEMGISTRVRDIDRAFLANADEVFVTNSQVGLWPVCDIEGRIYMRGAVTQQLMRSLAKAGVPECDA